MENAWFMSGMSMAKAMQDGIFGSGYKLNNFH